MVPMKLWRNLTLKCDLLFKNVSIFFGPVFLRSLRSVGMKQNTKTNVSARRRQILAKYSGTNVTIFLAISFCDVQSLERSPPRGSSCSFFLEVKENALTTNLKQKCPQVNVYLRSFPPNCSKNEIINRRNSESPQVGSLHYLHYHVKPLSYLKLAF